jgi:hypothetical protein
MNESAEEPAEVQAGSEKDSSIAREIVGGLIAAGIALGCVLPPLLHILTGPLGPLIGGAVVGHHLRPGARGRIVIGVTLGVFLAGLGTAATAAVRAYGGVDGAPDWFPSVDSIGVVLGGVFVYATALGAAGSALGARINGGAA